MKQYRFKTEQEFIDEYGAGWRNAVPNSWSDAMDYYLGKTIPDEFQMAAAKGNHFNTGSWSFSPEMCTEIEPKYKNGVMTVKNGLLKKF